MRNSMPNAMPSSTRTSVAPPPPAPERPRSSRSERLRRHPAVGWAATAARLILAGVFAVAGLAKIGDPAASVRAVRAYELLPDGLETLVGRGLPALEVALAVALLLGVALRAGAAIAAVLLTAFTIGVASAAARGLQIDCGCFGGGGATEDPKYAMEIARDLGLLALALGLLWVGSSRLAVGPRTPAAPRLDGAATRKARVLTQRHLEAQGRHRRVQRLLAGGVVGAVLLSGATGVAIAAATAPAPPTAIPAGVTAAGGIMAGRADAPRTLVVYADPQCPVCGQFEQTSGAVLTEAIADGSVRVEYRMRSFLGPESVRAVAALGAAQDADRFEALRVAMFASQPEERSGGFTVEDLLRLGASVGLTDAAFVDAVRNQTYAAWARQIDDRASRDGNTGTPDLLLDGMALDSAVVFDAAALRSALQG